MCTKKSLLRFMFVLVCFVVVLGLAACSGDDCPNPNALEKETSMTRERIDEAVEKARAIRHKYEDLFWRQPNIWGAGIGKLEDENNEWDGRVGFVIHVTQKVDQSTLPPEDRIPDCLEGVPVQIREESEPYLE